MNDYKLDLEKLIPVSQPDLDTIICRLPGTGPNAPVVTLRKSLDGRACRLSINVTIAGREVRLHHANMTDLDWNGWTSLEFSLFGIQDNLNTQTRKAAVELLTTAGVFPKFPLK